jgi:hypothetical protein
LISNYLSHALDAAMKLANTYIQNSGRYMGEESWGPEGSLYLSESAYALLTIFEITNEPKFLAAVESILEEVKLIQRNSGGIGLHLGSYGDGLRFKVSEEVAAATSSIEDIPPTAALLKVVADYERITGSNKFIQVGVKAFDYLTTKWSDKDGCFADEMNPTLQALRSNPRSYQLFCYLGIKAWNYKTVSNLDEIRQRLLTFIVQTFESYDENTMPLVYGLHAAVLCEVMPPSYLHENIKPRIDKHLSNRSQFYIHKTRGAYGHRDGQRGIVLDEAHIRSACGAAIAMRFYDLHTNSNYYQSSEQYQYLAEWIAGMHTKDGFYEFQDMQTMRKHGKGSPGQYLPIWWITGRI